MTQTVILIYQNQNERANLTPVDNLCNRFYFKEFLVNSCEVEQIMTVWRYSAITGTDNLKNCIFQIDGVFSRQTKQIFIIILNMLFLLLLNLNFCFY